MTTTDYATTGTETGVKRYRKKPVEVDAIQWNGSNLAAVQALTGPERAWIFRDGRLCVITLGERLLAPGDWVLREGDGSISVMGGKSFPFSYEAAATTGETA